LAWAEWVAFGIVWAILGFAVIAIASSTIVSLFSRKGRLYLLAAICFVCFGVGFSILLFLIMDVWDRHWELIVSMLGLLGIGWLLKREVNKRDERTRVDEERENQLYREKMRREYREQYGTDPDWW